MSVYVCISVLVHKNISNENAQEQIGPYKAAPV